MVSEVHRPGKASRNKATVQYILLQGSRGRLPPLHPASDRHVDESISDLRCYLEMLLRLS